MAKSAVADIASGRTPARDRRLQEHGSRTLEPAWRALVFDTNGPCMSPCLQVARCAAMSVSAPHRLNTCNVAGPTAAVPSRAGRMEAVDAVRSPAVLALPRRLQLRRGHRALPPHGRNRGSRAAGILRRPA